VRVFVDTSAFLALANRLDNDHPTAAQIYPALMERRVDLVTSSYVIAETMALIQRRLGWEPLVAFSEALEAAFHVVWVDRSLHGEAQRFLFRRRRRAINIVDAVSMTLTRQLALDALFAFDDDFVREGFHVLSGPEDIEA
jgi:predicted nucleic acid-binding protein